MTRETDGAGGNTGDATKVFVSGSITWSKVDNAGTLQGGATFVVCRTHNLDTSTDPDTFVDLVPDQCVTVVDDVDGVPGGTADEDPDPGQFRISGLVLGRYTVDETVAPPGFEPDPDVVTVELTLASPNATIAAGVREQPADPEDHRIRLHQRGDRHADRRCRKRHRDLQRRPPQLRWGCRRAQQLLAGRGRCGRRERDAHLRRRHNPAPFTRPITGTVAAGADFGPITVACNYVGMADGAVITATLNVNTTTNGLERAASGSPATISFTVQSD